MAFSLQQTQSKPNLIYLFLTLLFFVSRVFRLRPWPLTLLPSNTPLKLSVRNIVRRMRSLLWFLYHHVRKGHWNFQIGPAVRRMYKLLFGFTNRHRTTYSGVFSLLFRPPPVKYILFSAWVNIKWHKSTSSHRIVSEKRVPGTPETFSDILAVFEMYTWILYRYAVLNNYLI